MGRHRRRSRSRERKRPRRRRISGSRSSSESTSRSRHHGKRRRIRDRPDRYKHKQPRSAESRHSRGLSTSTSHTGASFSVISHSAVSPEERSSSSSPEERTLSPGSESSVRVSRGGRPPSRPPIRGGRPPALPTVNGRPPSPQEINITEPPPPNTGEVSPEGVLIIDNDVVLTEDTLQALGEQDQGGEKALDIHPIVKKRWMSILTKGLEKTEKSVLLEKYLMPVDLNSLNAPTLNDEVLKAIPANTQNKDKFQKNNQNQLGKGLTALGAGMNVLITNETINKENKHLILTFLAESGKILSDVHYNMSLTRRALITPTLSKTIGEISKTAPVEQLLFGADLTEKIKAVKAIERSVGDIKQKPETFSRIIKKSNTAQAGSSKGVSFRKNLNVRGPSGFRREPGQQRGRYLQQQGRKTNYQTRRD